MDQYSINSNSTLSSSSSSPSPHLPLFLDSLPFLSPSSLLPPPPPAPSRSSKKRSRASRRAPTTVLTTDTSNFRAMVQEFTGIPSPPFSSPPFLIRPFSHKHQTPSTAPNTFLQSLINTQQPKPPHPSPPLFSMVGREELQQSALLDSWICSSDYK